MEYNRFVEKCGRTLSPNYHLDSLDQNAVMEAMEDFIAAGERLDALKKAFAYGSEKRIKDFNGPCYNPSEDKDIPYRHAIDYDILHGVLGMATESVEMVAAVYTAMYETGELDVVNLNEEVFDSDWYRCLLIKTQAQQEILWVRGIAKLAARFPEKFDSETELNRDVEAERVILEEGGKLYEI